jgi:hypothetical protein
MEVIFKKGDIVKYKNPFSDEVGLEYVLVEDPDGDRVLGTALVNMIIKPIDVLRIEDIKMLDEPSE